MRKLPGLPKAKAHPHAFKHPCALQLIDSAGIHRTQAWLGHKSMASTGAYLKPGRQGCRGGRAQGSGGFDFL